MLSVQVGKEATKFVLCHLTPNKCEQWAMDLGFSADEDVTFFLTGKTPVHLTGFFEDEDEDDFDDDELDDELDDEDEDEEDEESAAAAGLSRFAKAARRLKPSARPKQLPCRERNLEEVAGALREAVREGGLGCALYLSGTPGTGKTATVRQASRRVGRPGPAAAQPSLCAGRRPRSRLPPGSEGPRRSLYVPFECSLGRLGAEAVEALPGPATEMGGGPHVPPHAHRRCVCSRRSARRASCPASARSSSTG